MFSGGAPQVRKQTRDVAAVLRVAAGAADYFVFGEDDMELCRHGFLATSYLLNRATKAYPRWLAIRASFGMNGIFLHDADVLPFAGYLEAHQARRPPDHLVVEWYAGETDESKRHKAGRAHLGFKWNIFDHLGHKSTR